MTELEYLEAISNYLLAVQPDHFAAVAAACAAIVVTLFAVCGCMIGFFSGVELLKIWK